MKHLKSRLMALLLAVILVLTSSASVWAEVLPDETTADTVAEETEVIEQSTEEAMEETTETAQTPSMTEEVTEDAAGEATDEVVSGGEVTDGEIAQLDEIEASTNSSTIQVKTIVKGKVTELDAVVQNFSQSGEIELSGNVYINQNSTCGSISIPEGKSLNLIIKDGVTLNVNGSDNSTVGILCCSENRALSITAGTDNGTTPKGTGKLIVYGGKYKAAIGGSYGAYYLDDGRNITIESCTVEAHGGDQGAGIGGGEGGNGVNITINGGTVKAYGGEQAAGIGGGFGGYENGNGSNITINGGTVYAYGGTNAAGIGGGMDGNMSGMYINENITDDNGEVVKTYVEAHGSEGGAGIGGGYHNTGSNITITGGTVKAYGGYDFSTDGGAGIGGGDNSIAYNISISGGDVYAQSRNGAAAIGGGTGRDGYDITISGGKVYADAYGASNAKDGAGIGGGGDGGTGYRISITGGTVTARSGGGAGIGGGFTSKLKNDGCGVSITGGHIEAFSYNYGAGIGGGENGGCEGDITISGSSTYVYAQGGGAGIGSGKTQNCKSNITINEGYVTAKSVGTGAGIGSGADGKYKGTINIKGGNVTATGGGTGNACDKNNGTGCALGCGSTSSDISSASTRIEAVYVSTALGAKFSYNDGGTYTQSIVPYSGNWVTADASYNINGSKWRDVKITNNVDREVAITGTQQGEVTYGAAGNSTYSLSAHYVSGTDWGINWYDKDGNALSSGPATFAVSSDMKTASLMYDGTSNAGDYQFTLSCDGFTSGKAAYKVNQRAAEIISDSASKVYDGTPLTCETYETDGFIGSQGVNVTCTGTCTGSMLETVVAENTFTYTAKSGTNLANYAITETEGTLTVSHQSFVVTGEKYKAIYDGKVHEFSAKVIGQNGIDYTDKATITYYTSNSSEGPFEKTGSDGSVKPSVKDVGSRIYVKAEASAVINGETKTIESDVYYMQVKRRESTLTAASATKEYDGTPLTNNTVTLSGDGFVEGEGFADGASPIAHGSITTVGKVENSVGAYGLNNNTNSTNYEFDRQSGVLEVTPKTSQVITITTPSNSKTYDGKTIDAGAATWNDGVLENGDTLTVTLENTDVKDAGTYDNAIESYKVTNASGEDVTNCYTFTEPVIGTLTIEKRQLTLTSGSDMKVKSQDGDYAYNDEVTVSGEGLVEGEGLTYSDFQKITEVSSEPTENTFKYAADADTSSAFNADNYDITVKYGYLMLADETTIFGVDQTFTYDGTPQVPEVEVIDVETKAEVTAVVNDGQDAVVNDVQDTPFVLEFSTSTDNENWSDYTTDKPKFTDAGTYYVRARVTKDGQVKKEKSFTIVVEKRNVVLTSQSAVKVYDGKELTAENCTVSGDGFIDGQDVNITYTGTQTDAGSSENQFEYEFKNEDDKKNYNIQTVYGTLKVIKNTAPVIISTDSREWVYNGTAMSCSENCSALWKGKTIENGETLCGNDELQIMPNGSITDVGIVENTCDYKVVRNGVDVTDNYTFAEPKYGTLTVKARSIVINTASADKIYDGTALTSDQYTVSGDGFIGGQGFESVNIVGTRTNAGTAANVLDETTPYTLKTGTKAENYNITVEPGTLTVNKRKVTVSSGSAVTTAPPDATIATVTSGSAVTTAPTDATNPTVTVTGNGFVEGEVTFKAVGVQTVVTEDVNNPKIAENTVNYQWAGSGNPANYEITENLGKLVQVSDGIVYAVASDYEGVYDGKGHNSEVSLQSGVTASYKINGKDVPAGTDPASLMVNAGTYNVVLSVEKGDNTASWPYTVTINQRSLVLTAGSAEKVYDGEELTAGYTIGGEGFANDTEADDAHVKTTGKITDAGNVTNTIAELKDKGSFIVKNYDISYNSGKLTVTKRPVQLMSVGFAREYAEVPEEIIITGGKYKGTYSTEPVTYDGRKHGCEAVVEIGKGLVQGTSVIPDMGFVDGEGAVYYDFTKNKDAGLYKNTFAYRLNSNTKAGNYDIECIYGLMKIVPCDVTVTSASDSKKYDGTPLENDIVKVKTSLKDNQMPKGSKISFNVTGSQTKVGKSANTFDWTMTNYKEINYNVTKVEGTLEVYNSDTLRIVGPQSQEYLYDGKAHGEAAKAYIGDTPLEDTVIWYSTDGGTTYTDDIAQLTNAGTLEIKARVEKYGYETAYCDYVIEVLPREVTLTSASAEKVYDGKALTNDEVKISGDGFAEGEGASYKVTGSQTEVGSSANTFTYTLNNNTKADNYKITCVDGILTVTAAASGNNGSPGTGTDVNSMIPAVLALIACAGTLVVVMKKRNNA